MENLPRSAAEFGKLVRRIWKNLPQKTVAPSKNRLALPGNPISELQDITCHMRSHSVTCHLTQLHTSEHAPPNPSHAGDLSTPEGWKAELT